MSRLAPASIGVTEKVSEASAAGSRSRPLEFRVVAVGASAAASGAILSLFEAMPPSSGVAFILLQEPVEGFAALSISIIAANTAMKVCEGEDGTPIQPDHLYVVGAGWKARVCGGALHLEADALSEGSLIDEAFRSLAADQREGAVGIRLAGPVASGLQGARAIKAAGGVVLAQDPVSTPSPIAPRGLIENGWADFVARPEEMQDILGGLTLVRSRREHAAQAAPAGEEPALPGADPAIDPAVPPVKTLSGTTHTPGPISKGELRYRALLDGIADQAIFMTDTSGRVEVWPEGAQRLLGYAASAALGQPLHALLKCEREVDDGVCRALAEVSHSGSVSLDGWFMRKDGSRFWGRGCLWTAPRIQGSPEGFVGVLRDATEEKSAEEALHQAKCAAEAANRAKDSFLATVSHELRTPLAAMLLWAKLLDDERLADPQRLREGLEAIRKCAEEQQELIEDLLDTSRIVTGKLRLEIRPTDLVSVVRAAAEAIRPAAEAKGLLTETSIDARIGSVEADPHRVKQMIWNLLNNAVKFTPPGGRVSLEARRLGDDVEIRVEDTGPGIPLQRLPHVFDRFRQSVNATSRVTGGLGLGLSITKQLVELHGGTIDVQSGAGRGCVFTIRLPLPERTEAQVTNTGSTWPEEAAKLRGCHIFLVEDSPDTQRALRALLHDAGARVSVYSDAASALADYLERRPDLILSDIGLPAMDGHELIRQIRALERSRQLVPVTAVALTAFADEKNCRCALENGFQKCLTKPIDPLRLLSALAHLR